MKTMKLSLAIVLTAPLLLLSTRSMVFAATSVTVENGGSGSQNSVNINQNSQFNSSSSNTVDSKTHVTITTNGETKTFDTNGDESVDWKSEDGKSQVKINNNSVKGTSTTSSPTPLPTRGSTVTPPPAGGPSPTGGLTPTASPTPGIHGQQMSLSDFLNKYFSWFSELFK